MRARSACPLMTIIFVYPYSVISGIQRISTIKSVKTKLKICLLETQNIHDMFVWYEFNFDHFSF